MNIQTISKCIINLPHRTDRMKQILTELPNVFDDLHFVLINGVEHKYPKNGVAQAHLNCIRVAKANGWPCVLIMEDDCTFRKGAKEYMTEAFNNIPENWNVLLGGVYESNGLSLGNEYWNRTKQFCGLHFYIVRSDVYDRLLAYDGTHHFDRFINFENDLNCYVAAKIFATQRDGFSDNVKKDVKYESKLNKFKLL